MPHLHELAVNAIVIDDYGKPDGEHPDLAERYILHRGVLNWSDAQTYQSNSAITGYEPFTDDEMDAMRDEHKDLVARYGTDYKGPYGWAARLVPGGRPNFRDLESLANVSFLRGHYQWASHEVHADAKGWALNVFEVNDTLFRATGPLDMGFADPGHLALISLHQCLTALVFSGEEISPSDILSCMAIQRLVDDAGDEFAKASDAVTEHYARTEAREHRRAEPPPVTD